MGGDDGLAPSPGLEPRPGRADALLGARRALGPARRDRLRGGDLTPAGATRFIGWSADALAANLDRVLYNQRFPVLPGVRARGLALRSLEMATDRIADDWEAKRGARPVLA